MNYQYIREKLVASLENIGIETILVQDLENIYYLTGFQAANSSRPFGLVLNKQNCTLIVPATAANSAKVEAPSLNIEVYYEHPVSSECSMSFHTSLTKIISSIAQAKLIGVEAGTISLVDMNVLSDNGFEVQDITDQISLLRSIKDTDELDAIRLSAKYADYNIEKTLEAIHPGITEIEFDQVGAFALRQEVAKKLPQARIGTFIMSTSGTERTAMPHTNSSLRQVQEGDSILLCRQVAINGYRAQCDRMGFVGKPNQEQDRYYSVVLAAHSAALDIIRPGISASNVDKAIRDVFEKEGLEQYFVHRSGSGLGVSISEAPQLRFDSDETLMENMALIIQPAIYIPGVGGFRCSDTVVVQKDGCELITHYPRDIHSLTLTKKQTQFH